MPSDALIASQASELELEAGYLRAHCEEQVVHQRAASGMLLALFNARPAI